MCSCLKEKPPRTSFDPSGSQSGNQGRVNFKSADKQMIEKIKQLHKWNKYVFVHRVIFTKRSGILNKP